MANIENSRINISLQRAIIDMMHAENTTIFGLAKKINVEYPTLKKNILSKPEPLRSSVLLNYLDLLGVEIVFTAYAPGFIEVKRSCVYHDKCEVFRNWLINMGYDYIGMKGLTRKSVMEIYEISRSVLMSAFSRQPARSSTKSTIDVFTRIGMDVRVTLRHPYLNASKYKDLQVSDYGFTEVTDENGTCVLDFLSQTDVSRMQRGQFKTSMGEVVRAFL